MAAAAFTIFSTISRLKVYSPGQLVFGLDMIISITHKVYLLLIGQRKQTQINKDNTHKNSKRFDHDYKVRDKVMLNNHAAYKYETPYKGPFVIKKRWNNSTVILQYDTSKMRYNMRRIKPYTYDRNVGNINPKDMCDDENI